MHQKRKSMAQLIVRNLEEAVKRKLKRRAARNGRSLEEEMYLILSNAVNVQTLKRKGLGTEIAEHFRGLELGPIRELRINLRIPNFDSRLDPPQRVQDARGREWHLGERAHAERA
jgi:plasmid stability protein